jgi:hypothetical protein
MKSISIFNCALIVLSLVSSDAYLNSHAGFLLLNNSLHSFPEVIPVQNHSMFVYVRVQKTGSKTLVNLLEHSKWPSRPTCAKTGGIGQTTSTCHHLAKKALKIRSLYEDKSHDFPCLIDGHCGIDVFTRLMFDPSSSHVVAGSRPFVVTVLRSPAERTISE